MRPLKQNNLPPNKQFIIIIFIITLPQGCVPGTSPLEPVENPSTQASKL
jgi:hypothetical protein